MSKKIEKMYNHPRDRNKISWLTRDRQRILIKDLSNSHLNNILTHIKDNRSRYSQDLLDLIEIEICYRQNNDIIIADYPSSKPNYDVQHFSL